MQNPVMGKLRNRNSPAAGPLRKSWRWLASLKVAIPLLVLLVIVTMAGSLLPTPDVFGTRWYLGLLGLLGLSLLLVTIQHMPAILRKKGRNALIGVITTHLGILVLIGGVIYGGYSGFRHDIKLVEGDVTVVPGLPFVVRLDELIVEEYRQEELPGMNLDRLPKRRQDARITLLKQGKPVLTAVAAPGSPTRFDGITLLPSIGDTGRYFELIVTDPWGREKIVPIRPWAPPLINIGGREIMAHTVTGAEITSAEIFAKGDDGIDTLGHVLADAPLAIDRYTLSLGQVRQYTGIQVYSRPQEPVLVAGSVLMFAGLVWHFYFRHRDRRREGRSDA